MPPGTTNTFDTYALGILAEAVSLPIPVVILPFVKLDSDEDVEKLVGFAQRTIDFFAETALEHERTGEMIDRIGLANFLDAMEIDADPAMISSPRMNPYVRTDGWDEEVAKINAKKHSA